MTLVDLLDEWRTDPQFARNVAAWRTLPARPARTVDFPLELHPQLADALRLRGITQLYTHQGSAWRALQAGQHLVVVTGTASGKTLCYNAPVLDAILRAPDTRALYLFPTKALAQDQADELRQLWRKLGETRGDGGNKGEPFRRAFPNLPADYVATYDGDTPTAKRLPIRNQARVVITNPDMLHTGILPHHTLWATFFRHLRFVVIDELHALRGVFGSHVANVLRRLRRVAQFYGVSPQFVMASATIANPVELAQRMIESSVTLIADDGAPRGEKHFVIYNPPIIAPELGLRRSAMLEAVRLSAQLLDQDTQTIVFARSRQSVELVLSYLQQSLRTSQSPIPNPPSRIPTSNFQPSTFKLQSSTSNLQSPITNYQSLRAYRGGYLPTIRREIERGLRDGNVRGVVATNALELGIDIGRMSASVMVGYPGTVAATWQQAGRAGRTSETSLALLVVSSAPIDQYLAHQPAWFFGRSPEHGLINPDNLIILLHHLRCAAFELPFQKNEAFGNIAGARVKEFLDFLSAEGVVHESNEKYFWLASKYPADGVSLRSASPEQIVIQMVDETPQFQIPNSKSQLATRNPQLPITNYPSLGTIDLHSAYWMLHPQAIYMHEGQAYFVDALDLEQKIARVRPVNVDYYTEATQEVTITLSEQVADADVCGGHKAYGEVKVTSQVTGFRKIKLFTHENLGVGEVTLPPTELLTMGYWLSLNDETVERLREMGLWRNDANDYGAQWREIRERVRERDGYRCQMCGVKEETSPHHVHHKIPFRQFANAHQANQLSNLITLCPSCHHKAETAVRMRSGLAGLAFVLGHIAPLLLMCDRRDVGVQSDPKSPLTDGRPTIVIYDQAPAGIGLSERLYELHDDLLARAHELIASCDCADGCPSCVGPAGESGEGGKQETRALLEVLSEN
jgi:DEAD/DEAH box helicase domain-containing protein